MTDTGLLSGSEERVQVRQLQRAGGAGLLVLMLPLARSVSGALGWFCFQVQLLYCASSQVALEELQDLKGVWSELSKVWEQIDQMKEQPWVSVQPRKVGVAKDRCCVHLHVLTGRCRER